MKLLITLRTYGLVVRAPGLLPGDAGSSSATLKFMRTYDLVVRAPGRFPGGRPGGQFESPATLIFLYVF